jgi:mRNA interferase MazF
VVTLVRRGELYWVDLGPVQGSAPVLRRPVLIVQADPYNDSHLATVTIAALTSNTQAGEHPGNVFVPAAASALPKDSVVNVSQLITLGKDALGEKVSDLPSYLMGDVDAGLRRILSL